MGGAEPEHSRLCRSASRPARSEPSGAPRVSRGEHRSPARRTAGVGGPRSTGEAGELPPGGAGRGKGAPGHRAAGGKHGGDTEPHNRVNATPADSGAGTTGTAVGVHLAEPPPRSAVAA